MQTGDFCVLVQYYVGETQDTETEHRMMHLRNENVLLFKR